MNMMSTQLKPHHMNNIDVHNPHAHHKSAYNEAATLTDLYEYKYQAPAISMSKALLQQTGGVSLCVLHRQAALYSHSPLAEPSFGS